MVISIKNFGPIQNVQIDLDTINVLVGDYETGKTLLNRIIFSIFNDLSFMLEKYSSYEDYLIKELTHYYDLTSRDTNICVFKSFIEAEEKILEITFRPTKIKVFQLNLIKDLSPIYCSIPLEINNEYMKNSRNNKHLMNLKSKLIKHNPIDFIPSEKILNIFDELFQGELDFDYETDNFYFKFSENKLLPVENLANGFKSFIILKELYLNGHINHKSLLILDEPIIFSHPRWQIKYAKLLTLLVKDTGIGVILNTYSIYFIEALEVLSKKQIGKNSIDFYLLKHLKNNLSEFKLVTNNIQDLYNDLIEPLESLTIESYEDDL